MNTKRGMWLFSFLAIVFVMSGCASQQPTVQPPIMQIQSLAGGNWQQKADNLVFVLDASSSMLEPYNGVEKFSIGRNVVGNFNQTMPDLTLQTALRSFGHAPVLSHKSTALWYGVSNYSRQGVADALGKIVPGGGPSPMGKAFMAVTDDLKNTQGKIAMVLVSDGKDMDKDTLQKANALKTQYGDRLCIYTVLVGDDDAGRALLTSVSGITGCGSAITADDLASGPQMADFVKTVLLNAVTPPPAPAPAPKAQMPPMSKAGTWVFKDINFEFDKSTLISSSYPTLENIYAAMRDNPEIVVEIQGHTDSVGTNAYNKGLSQRRAHTVVEYLKNKGIDASRMTAKGYGEESPMDTNDTVEGRANNRRVELKPMK